MYIFTYILYTIYAQNLHTYRLKYFLIFLCINTLFLIQVRVFTIISQIYLLLSLSYLHTYSCTFVGVTLRFL